VLGILVLPVTAQEELPPPEKTPERAARPAAGERPTRTERRERRRRRLRGLFDQLQQGTASPQSRENGASPGKAAEQTADRDNGAAGSPIGSLLQGLTPLLASPADRGGPGAAPLESEKLNRAIDEELARPLVGQLDNIESLELRFDQDQTDFARDRLGVTGRVRLKSAPWGAPADMRLRLRAGLRGGLAPGGRAVLKFHIDMMTDSVAFCNFVKYRALQRCYQADRTNGAAEDQEAFCRLLEATPDFRSLTDLADFVANMGIVNLQAANRKIERLQAQLQAVEGSNPPPSLVDALGKAYRSRDSLLASSVRVTRDATLQVPRIDVQTVAAGPATQFAQVEFVDMTITPDGIHGDLHASIGPAGVLLYQGAKGVLIEPTLRRLQQRDPATLERLRQGGRDIHRQLEELETPPEDDVPPAPAAR